MARSSLIEQMLEYLVNDDAQKAEELFHEYVVKQSREIYESLIESEMHDMHDMDDQDDDMDEAFGDEGPMDLDSEDPTDDLAGDLGDDDGMDDMGDMEDEGEDAAEGNLYQDLESIIDDLQAKFDELKSHEDTEGEFGDDGMEDIGDDEGMDDLGDDEGMDDLGDEDDEMMDSFNHSTVREYVERVPAGHGAERKGQAEKSDKSATGLKFNKNDMGGTTANILSGRNGADAGEWGTSGGQLKGNGLLKGGPKEMNTGNLNKVGGFKGDAYKKNNAGHGAEKKGTAEKSTDGQSLFRGRR